MILKQLLFFFAVGNELSQSRHVKVKKKERKRKKGREGRGGECIFLFLLSITHKIHGCTK
jgi:hypothetical protein